MIWGGGNRVPVQQSSFIVFLVQVRTLVAHCYEVAKVAALFIMFSAVTGKLNWSRSQVEKRNTEELLYLVSRLSLSGKGNKRRTLKRCIINP